MRFALPLLAALTLALAGCDDGLGLPDRPQIQPDRTALNFGGDFGAAVYVNTQPQQTLQLKNGGLDDLVITAVTIDGADAAAFKVQTDKPLPETVKSRDVGFAAVTFSPTQAKVYKATLHVASNAENHPVLDVPLQGTAVAK